MAFDVLPLDEFKKQVASFASEHPAAGCEVCHGYDRLDMQRAGATCACGAPLAIHATCHPHSAFTDGCVGFRLSAAPLPDDEEP